MIDPETVVPTAPLGAFLNKHLGGSTRPLAVEKVGQGRSNLTFRVTRGAQSWILRRPPMGELPETAHDMLREYRVLSGLAGTTVRAPRPVLACSNPNVIGVPFYLMEVVEGVVIREQVPGQFGVVERGVIGEQMVDALAELHTVEPSSVGLGDLGRPEGYTARQVARWSKQWGVMATRALPDIEVVREWLAANVPQISPAAIVHGDYKLDNVVFGAETPPRLLAILDWEMATLGDPLADLGYLLMFWPEAGEPNIGGLPQPTRMEGFPPRSALIERYEHRTGFAMTDLNFYRTLALWKLAILTEGLYKRYLAGKADGDWFAILETAVPQMAAVAREWSGA
ncbi:MAG: phosphotransferase [Nitriliruptorales bacterium]|nr:phosphotransferase [Nitriliruptorales bacterium]